MLSFLILILCLNIDALSYGVAYGLKKQKLNIIYILAVSLLSSIMFAIPLYFSKYIFKYFNSTTCHIINGVVLILLGIHFFLQKPTKNNENSSKKSNCNEKFAKNSKIFTSTDINLNKTNIPFKQYFVETLVISVDAIFTALLSGFNDKYFVFYVFFYGFTNFLAIFLGNMFFYQIDKKIKINLNYFSGIIFIFLGILKFFGI